MTQLEKELDKKLEFHAPYKGVFLSNGELTQEEVQSLEDEGNLVLMSGSQIEVEDQETGQLMVGEVTITNDDFFLFDVKDKNGKIVHEEEVPLYVYLLQLDACGALDAYPRVDLQ